jgi:hypothetical protein
MGCNAIEDPHHVFVLCKAFGKLRDKTSGELMEKTRKRIETTELEEAQFTSLLTNVKDFSITYQATGTHLRHIKLFLPEKIRIW